MAVPVASSATGPGGMDEVDHHGNTPLLLALQLGRLECANVSIPDTCACGGSGGGVFGWGKEGDAKGGVRRGGKRAWGVGG